MTCSNVSEDISSLESQLHRARVLAQLLWCHVRAFVSDTDHEKLSYAFVLGDLGRAEQFEEFKETHTLEIPDDHEFVSWIIKGDYIKPTGTK